MWQKEKESLWFQMKASSIRKKECVEILTQISLLIAAALISKGSTLQFFCVKMTPRELI